MVGGFGSDTYIVDSFQDEVREEVLDSGVDTVITSLDHYELGRGSGIENLRMARSSGLVDGIGNELNNTIVARVFDPTPDPFLRFKLEGGPEMTRWTAAASRTFSLAEPTKTR